MAFSDKSSAVRRSIVGSPSPATPSTTASKHLGQQDIPTVFGSRSRRKAVIVMMMMVLLSVLSSIVVWDHPAGQVDHCVVGSRHTASCPKKEYFKVKHFKRTITAEVAINASDTGSVDASLIYPHHSEIESPDVATPPPPTQTSRSDLHHSRHCGHDATTYRHGLPSPKGPVDSVVAVTFDLTPEESQRSQDEIFDLVVNAMGSNSADVNSDYFTFFLKRNAEWTTPTLERNTKYDSAVCTGVEPFTMDVVYTHVNPSSPSHQAAMSMCYRRRLECAESRFRDWGELQHSMRTVFFRGMCNGSTANHKCHALIKNVHVVVAHEDQVPDWLNKSHERVHIVNHTALFPVEDQKEALPTFNSHGIESRLHRIPNLSRFFVYFNNDMLWGTRVSIFDYLRPLCPVRQNFRMQNTDEGKCLWSHLNQHKQVPASPIRVTMLFEPIFYFEKLDDPNDRTLIKNDFGEINPIEGDVQHQQDCPTRSLNATIIFSLKMKTPKTHDMLHKITNHNRRLLFNAYGAPPSHSFAHYPRLVDRDLQQQMIEDELLPHARHTWRSPLRGPDLLWTTYAYQYAALAHRRAVDRDIGVSTKVWQQPHSSDEVKTLSSVAPFVDIVNAELHPALFPSASWLTRLVPGSLLREKVAHYVVQLDGKKEPIYHFCMLQSTMAMNRYLRELRTKMKLFITLNDDIRFVMHSTNHLMHNLFELVTGDAGGVAPWEKADDKKGSAEVLVSSVKEAAEHMLTRHPMRRMSRVEIIPRHQPPSLGGGSSPRSDVTMSDLRLKFVAKNALRRQRQQYQP